MDGNWQVEFTKPGPTVYSNGFCVLVYRSGRKKKSASKVSLKKGWKERGGEKGFVLEPASKLGRYSDHWRLLRSDKVLGKGSIQLLRFFFI